MMNDQQLSALGGSSVPQPQSQASPASAGKKRWVLLVIGGILLLGFALLVVLSLSHKKAVSPGLPGSNTAAGKLFDEMLGTAAAKRRVRLTYAEQKYANKADFEAGKVKAALYSVAQLDVNTKEYRSVYANQQGPANDSYFVVRRCMEQGTMYKPDLVDIEVKTLAAAQNLLAKPLAATVPASSGEAKDCDPMDPDHTGRTTDGVIPAGLSQAQVQGWLQALKDAQFVTVEDKGMTTYRQKPVRKLHIVTSSVAGAASFFSAVQKGAGLQLTDSRGLPAADSYQMDEMSTSDNIDGFYLVDEQTKLPVYSQFTTLALLVNDKGQDGKVMKQAYDYPGTATLGQNTTIDTLE